MTCGASMMTLTSATRLTIILVHGEHSEAAIMRRVGGKQLLYGKELWAPVYNTVYTHTHAHTRREYLSGNYSHIQQY